MASTTLVDTAGRRRSSATLPGWHQGRPPRNKGLRYPADPPTVEEIIPVTRAAGNDADGVRLRGLIVVLWRAGLRISEALALTESELDASRGAILVRHEVVDRRRDATEVYAHSSWNYIHNRDTCIVPRALAHANWGDLGGTTDEVGDVRRRARRQGRGRCRDRARRFTGSHAAVAAPG